jgi:hypothetical protein
VRKKRKEQKRASKWDGYLKDIGEVQVENENDHSHKHRILKQLLKRGLASEQRGKATEPFPPPASPIKAPGLRHTDTHDDAHAVPPVRTRTTHSHNTRVG